MLDTIEKLTTGDRVGTLKQELRVAVSFYNAELDYDPTLGVCYICDSAVMEGFELQGWWDDENYLIALVPVVIDGCPSWMIVKDVTQPHVGENIISLAHAEALNHSIVGMPLNIHLQPILLPEDADRLTQHYECMEPIMIKNCYSLDHVHSFLKEWGAVIP